MTDFSELPTADQEAISKTLLTLLKAFDDRDAEPLRNVYSEDADWVNAFGTVKRGRDDIVEYLRGLLNDDNFNRGELSGPPETSFRVLTPDVVLVSAHLQVKGRAWSAAERWTVTTSRCAPCGVMFQDANTGNHLSPLKSLLNAARAGARSFLVLFVSNMGNRLGTGYKKRHLTDNGSP